MSNSTPIYKKYFQAQLVSPSPAKYMKDKYLTELQALRPENYFKQIIKRKFPRQYWNKKPGKPRKIVTEEDDQLMQRPFYLKYNNYNLPLY